MDIVIPYVHSTWAGTELKYALRSIEKHVQYDRVFIIGDKPDWLCNVTYIPFEDNPNIESKERNIMQKIMVGFEHTEDMYFMNDDHFILQKTDIENYPYYRGGELVYNKETVGAYRRSVNNTIESLRAMNKPRWNFDIHTPIVYSRDKFKEAMESVDWRKPNGYVIKSLYCNYFDIEGMPHIDLKIATQTPFHRLRKIVEGQDIFSIGDRAIGLPMKKLLDLYFSEKSKFEL